MHILHDQDKTTILTAISTFTWVIWDMLED